MRSGKKKKMLLGLFFVDSYCLRLLCWRPFKCPANCSNYMNNRQDCSMSPLPPFKPSAYGKFCNLYCSIMTGQFGAP